MAQTLNSPEYLAHQRDLRDPEWQEAQKRAQAEEQEARDRKRTLDEERREAEREAAGPAAEFHALFKSAAKIYSSCAPALKSALAVAPALAVATSEEAAALAGKLRDLERACREAEDGAHYGLYHLSDPMKRQLATDLYASSWIANLRTAMENRRGELAAGEALALRLGGLRLARAEKFKAWRDGLPDALARMEQGEIVPGYESAFGALLTAEDQAAIAEAAMREVTP